MSSELDGKRWGYCWKIKRFADKNDRYPALRRPVIKFSSIGYKLLGA
ncbi:hypothetical protein [uncultured Bacteroides sp.]|nr:hypothetical protein [uncultured Bacteroides sp.]